MRYVTGQRWQVRRPERPGSDFDFVIVGPGSKPDRKVCKVEYLVEHAWQKNFEAEFTHRHLKRYAKLENKS